MVKIFPRSVNMSNNTAEKVANLANHHNRLILGIGALSVEPFVDYYSNRNRPKEDRDYSVVKTVAKIAIGMTTGIAARYAGLWVGKKMVNAKITPLFDNFDEPAVKLREKILKVVDKKKLADRDVHLEDLGLSKDEAEVFYKMDLKSFVLSIKDRFKEPTDIYNKLKAGEYLKNSAKGEIKSSQDVDVYQKLVLNYILYGKSALQKFERDFGDTIGFITTILFTLALDVPLVNVFINKAMANLAPANKKNTSKEVKHEVK